MFEKSDAFDLFIAELFDEKLRHLSKTDAEYVSLRRNAVCEFDELLHGLPDETVKKLESFDASACAVAAVIQKHLYFEGFRDCVRLLRQLEIF